MLHVEKELVGVDLNPVTANEVTYQKVTTIEPTVLPAHGETESYDYDVKIITKKGGVYLAFLDRGACVSVSSVIVSYNYCSEIGGVLVSFSRTPAPVNDSYLVEQTGSCSDVNSINEVNLSGVCLSSGEWNITDGFKCLCKPGYELVNGSEGNVLECSGKNNCISLLLIKIVIKGYKGLSHLPAWVTYCACENGKNSLIGFDLWKCLEKKEINLQSI